MFYCVCKLQFDGFATHYPKEPEIIFANNEETAIRIYKQYHTVRGRQRVDVEELPVNYGVVRAYRNTLYVGNTKIL